MAGYHRGEFAVQERAGLRGPAARAEPAIRRTIPPAAAAFLAEQPMIVLGSRDAAGRVWAGLRTGVPGFARATGESTVAIDALPVPGDPLAEAPVGPTPVGLLAIAPATRRRMRVNGTAYATATGLRVEAQQVYANCPKYIQRRVPTATASAPGPARRGTALTPAQRDLIARTDTFFVATADEAGAADVSHRGGNPGFLRLTSPGTLRWPDYVGNAMFMTLGNLAVHPGAGVLVPDWSSGTTLQLTGTARVIWDAAEVGEVPGAQRLVEFELAEAVEIPGGSPLRWSAPEYSRHNPSFSA